MDCLFCRLNYWAIFVSGIAFWLVGAIWFSAIFGKIWARELENIGIKIKKPKKHEFITKSLTTLLLNIVVAFGVSVFVQATGSATISSAIGFGLILGICFSAVTMITSYVWVSRSLKLILIDVGYPITGILVCSLILTFWK